MTHGRKPRRARWPAGGIDTIATAKRRVALVTAADAASVTAPLDAAFTAMRQGVGSEWDWAHACSAVNCAVAIEKQGVVKGLYGHLHSAELALQAISQRAMANGHWQATALFDEEIEAIDLAIDLHKFQLQKLSTGELIKALDYAQAEVRSSGGKALQAPPQTAALFA
jgi:hypothetical protein